MAKKVLVDVGEVEIELTDDAIIEASAEIYNEDPTRFLGNLIARASMNQTGEALEPLHADGISLN